jgi:hypothetical protein
VIRDIRRKREFAPAEFYCSLEEGVPERVAPAVFRFLQRREFPGEQTVWCLLWRYLKYAEHLRKPVFLLWQFSCRTPHGCNYSAGNPPPPRGNPGLKRTRMDTILKKF